MNFGTNISPLAAALLLAATAAPALAKPIEVKPPAELSCIHLSEALRGIEFKGLMKVESETRLERGPYISEHEDADGTYYRAPPGGVYLGPPKDKPAKGAWQVNRNGGIFVPRDPSALPQLYSYITDAGDSAGTVVPPAEANCANTSYARDPATTAVSVTAYAGAAVTAPSSTTVGVTGGPGVVGALIGAWIMSKDMGKIAKLPQTKNAEFTAKLGELARSAKPMKAAAPLP